MNQPFNPYAPPQQPSAPAAYSHAYGAPAAFQIAGPNLVAMSGAPLPDVCLKCGAQGGVVRKNRRFQWVPQWAYVVLVLSLLIGAIVIMIVQKRGTLDVPLCPSCKSRWDVATLAMTGAVLGILVVLLAVGVVAASGVLGDYGPIFALLLFGAWLVGVVVVSRVFVRARTVWAKRIENGWITVAGVHPNALAALASFAGAPRAS